MRVLLLLSFMVLFTTCKERTAQQTIYIQGSDTEIGLASTLAKQFSTTCGQKIQIKGGGSGKGIEQLIENKIDIANASRAMSASEIKRAMDNEVEPVPVIFAVDALAIIVNDAVPVDRITLDELLAIFSGKITSWKAFGGVDRPIHLFGRVEDSGTYQYFRDQVLKTPYAQSMQHLERNDDILEKVKRTPNGIGYVGLGYAVDVDRKVVPGIKVLSIGENEEMASSPLISSDIQSDRYPLVRPLYQYLNGQPNQKTANFIQFILSRDGQQIVSKSGYYPISPAYQVLNNQRISLSVDRG